jgi:hypothetical protein
MSLNFNCNYMARSSLSYIQGFAMTIQARFGLIWFIGFRGEDLNVIFD